MGEDIKDRIKEIMDRENLTSSAFADKLGLGRANISHILSGRNNASLEVVTKILEAFRDINPSWLLLGKGNMNNDGSVEIKDQSISYGDLFSNERKNSKNSNEVESKPSSLEQDNYEKNLESSISTRISPVETKIYTKNKEITKIIIYYNDNSFQSFSPSNDSL